MRKPRSYTWETEPTIYNGTWVEPEELAYNTYSGTCWGSNRKARVRFPDGRLRIVTLGIPDTYFSIPGHDCYHKPGCVMFNDDTGQYHWYPRPTQAERKIEEGKLDADDE